MIETSFVCICDMLVINVEVAGEGEVPVTRLVGGADGPADDGGHKDFDLCEYCAFDSLLV